VSKDQSRADFWSST